MRFSLSVLTTTYVHYYWSIITRHISKIAQNYFAEHLYTHNIFKFYVTSPSVNVATWSSPIQIICPHPFYQIISIVQQRFSILGIVCKTLKGYSLHFKNSAGATKQEQKQMTKESTETIQDMILRAWYSRTELMLAIATAAHMWGCGIA